ncbi:MAG: cytochrome-c oxidase, cbb3-type subunit III [Aquabacterium sp.]|nr:MAG: cytochrome-c oxidase, cbb3-type subunit III [Aquabacterium sp.]
MSDFTADGWAIFVAAVTIVSLVFCLLLLVVASRRKLAPGEDPDKPGTTGHVWDGDLAEMNNPLPRWWMWLFVLTVLFSAGYLVMYPGLGTYAGKLGWSSVGQYQNETRKAAADLAPIYDRFAATKTEDLARDPQAMAIGERLFINNCAACHGSDARGSKGFPNLTDNDWLHGGAPEKIEETIAKGRVGNMPVMAAAVGSAEDVHNVAHYVLSLSDSPHDSISAQLGRAKFAACAACHGRDGKGNPALGAPNLTDKVWLHGWGEAAIVNIVGNGKINTMPAHESRLTPQQIHVLGAYVWGLSNQPQVR